MSTLSLRLPTSLHRHLRVLAEREGVSINQLINAAIGEKVAALATLEYLQNRARRGSRVAFQAVLSKVPDSEPVGGDELPNTRLHPTHGPRSRAAHVPARRRTTGSARRG